MRNTLTMVSIMLVLILAAFSFAADAGSNVQAQNARTSQFEAAHPSTVVPASGKVLVNLRQDSLIWVENYETGAPGWYSVDETNPGEFWHQDSWMAYGGSGLSWWMADPALGTDGGYLSSWYQVLDSPDFTLTGSPTLTFVHRLNVENPAGASSPYDGWDGVNVRISTDGGTTWTVLTNPTPAYTANSLYSFGNEWGEGPDVPGWAGAITSWTPVTFDLSAYSGQTVRIRFAFASDGAYDTNDNPAMFGWQVDDIVVADGATVIYSNDGTQSDMTAANGAPVGGDYWHIASDPAAPSPPNYADANDPETGSYHPNQIASYISPYFWLPDTIDEAYFDFMLQGSYADNDAFPAVDYFGAYIQVKGENVWRYISNITMDPNGSNYVYSSAPDVWASFSGSYSTGLVDLSTLLGDSIRVKFTWESDEDTPQGTALQVDDVVVWTPTAELPPPTNLAANPGDGVVDLMWDEMNATSGDHVYMVHDDGSFENSIGLTSGTGDVGTMFDIPSAATQIDTIWVYGAPGNTGTAATLKVWEVGTTGLINPNPTYTKSVTITQDQWNVFDVSADNWMVNGSFVAGIEIGTTIRVPLDETTIPSQYSYSNLGGWSTWQAVAAANSLPDGEWGIRAAYTYQETTSFTYNVYRKLELDPNFGSPIATNLPTADYTDTGVTNGESYCYAVTANYPGEGESGLSEEVCGVVPQSITVYELAYDDGVAESYYGAGLGNYIAVKFDVVGWPQDVVRVKVFFQQGPGAAQVKLWDDDGANGLPGTELASVNLANVETGWNNVDISGVTIDGGDFYAGVRFAPTTPNLGIDETAPIDDMSYIKVGSDDWATFTSLGLNYDVMIRAELDSANVVGIENENNTVINNFELLQNYPNPFNPNTNIAFAVPNDMVGEKVVLKVYDVLGREVATLLNGVLQPGVTRVQWNGKNDAGKDATSGIYFYTIKAGDKVQSRKMMLMK